MCEVRKRCSGFSRVKLLDEPSDQDDNVNGAPRGATCTEVYLRVERAIRA
jgi:hypothetical protein